MQESRAGVAVHGRNRSRLPAQLGFDMRGRSGPPWGMLPQYAGQCEGRGLRLCSMSLTLRSCVRLAEGRSKGRAGSLANRVILVASHGRCLLPEDPPDRRQTVAPTFLLRPPTRGCIARQRTQLRLLAAGCFFAPQTAESVSIVTTARSAHSAPRRAQQGRKHRRRFSSVEFSEGDAGEGNAKLPLWRSAGC
jgi:hypothetical protein